MKTKKSAVGKVVHSILGCDIEEEVISDLKKLHSRIRGEAIAEFTEQIETFDGHINALTEQIARP